MLYVVDDPRGNRIQDVKNMPPEWAEYYRSLGFTLQEYKRTTTHTHTHVHYFNGRRYHVLTTLRPTGWSQCVFIDHTRLISYRSRWFI